MFATTPVFLAVTLLFTGFTSGMLDVAMNAAVSDTEAARGSKLMYGAHALFSLGGLAAFPTGIARQAGAQPAVVLSVVAAAYVLVGIGSIRAARSAPPPARSRTAADTQSRSRLDIFIGPLAILAVLCVMSFLIEDAATAWSALHVEQTLAGNPALGSAAPGMFALFMFLGRTFGQRLSNRFTDRALFVGGATCATFGLCGFALAPSPVVALAFVAVTGAGIALVAPALYARAGRSAGGRNRAAAIARLTSFGYTGFLVGPPLMGALSQAVGLRGAFSLLAGLAAILAVSGLLALRGGDRPGEFAEGQELLKTGRV
jgi:hypothetical protein